LKKKILVFRFSAFGDVAMTMPVLYSFRQAYPECEIVFVSRAFASDLVAPLSGVHFIAGDFKGIHKGLKGLFRLFRVLQKMGPWELVADMHGVMRTHILTFLLWVTGSRISKIDKGRKEKEALCRKENKEFRALKPSVERYRSVLIRGGFHFELQPMPGKELYGQADLPSGIVNEASNSGNIGVAPFAKHPWKLWPEEKMLELLKMLDAKGVNLFLFGGGGEEKKKLAEWSAQLSHGQSMVGRLTLAQELKLMSQLDVMISMDSANMHLASLVGTRVVSIWGATHPHAGFYGWGQSPRDAVQMDLSCRPCSVFGNKPCHRGDFACMQQLKVEDVLARLNLS
jgi:ADP-heptose:LPS heptosyltransferase